jgi:predicted ATPase/DNA-binding CsgD family transcriptional regulator
MVDTADSRVKSGYLPAALSSLVGRDEELAALRAALYETRLLTILGTGGCGKSRLALAVAEEARDSFSGGAWWVDLGSLTGTGLVASVVATTLDVPQGQGEDVIGTIARHLRDQPTLLVLDNCEHLVEDAADLTVRMLQTCPSLTVLATSRETLGVQGEQVFRAQGLRVPSSRPERTDDFEADAVVLFMDRARSADPSFSLDPSEAGMVTRLCRRLDGLPLAIELAAARVSFLGVADLVRRLDEDPGSLRHPSRSAPRRHRTLQDTLEWSHQLLSDDEQVLFRRLAAFHGSFSLLAAETVCAGGEIGRHDVVDLLSGLVDKSLVQVADRGAEHRYRLLQTVLQYAEDKLEASGEVDKVRGAHVDFYVALGEQARTGLEGPDQSRWLERLEVDHDNLRAALRQSLPDEPETGGRLAGALWPFWYRRGYYYEARPWLDSAVGVADKMSPAVRADALLGAGVLAFLQCDYRLGRDELTKALRIYQHEGNRFGAATALQRLGSIAREEAQYLEARLLHESSLAIWEELGDEDGVATSHDFLGFAAWLEGDFDRAEELCSQAVDTLRTGGLRQELAAALTNLGVTRHYRGDDDAALAALEEARVISEAIGYQEGTAWSLHELAVVGGRRERTADLLRRSLTIHFDLGDRWRVASVLESIAAVILARSDPRRAAELLGATAALREAIGTPVPPAERPDHERAVSQVQASLGPHRYERACSAGAAVSLEQAVDSAARWLEAPSPSSRISAGHDGAGGDGTDGGDGRDYNLTERERAVLRLVSEGLSNREIGKRLFISTGTAGVHVSNILRKLGVTSRVQAATIASRLDL